MLHKCYEPLYGLTGRPTVKRVIWYFNLISQHYPCISSWVVWILRPSTQSFAKQIVIDVQHWEGRNKRRLTVLTGKAADLGINHTWNCWTILTSCSSICDKSLGLLQSMCEPQPAVCSVQLGREHQDASASDISAILPGRMQEMMWVVRLIDHQCLNSKLEPMPVFLAIGLFCLFLDKVNQKKGQVVGST